MRIKIVTLLSLSLFLTGCVSKEDSSQTSFIDNSGDKSESKLAYDYADLDGHFVFWDDVIHLDVLHYYVYFFSRTCGHCEIIKSHVLPFILSTEYAYACEASSEHKLCTNPSTGPLDQINFCILGYPTIVEIKSRMLVRYASGESEVLEFLNKNTTL